MRKWVVISLIWALGGSLGLIQRQEFARKVEEIITHVQLPQTTSNENSLLEFDVNLENGEWNQWK